VGRPLSMSKGVGCMGPAHKEGQQSLNIKSSTVQPIILTKNSGVVAIPAPSWVLFMVTMKELTSRHSADTRDVANGVERR
jgi:hypothetical protein